MTRSRTFQVKDVARIAGVSVRTLHHYDAIGLLVPQLRTAAGYRVYIHLSIPLIAVKSSQCRIDSADHGLGLLHAAQALDR